MPVWLQFVTSVIVGGLAGTIAPFVNWHIEKRRARRQRKVDLMDEWRRSLIEWQNENDASTYGQGWHSRVESHAWYLSLRRHLTDEAREQLATAGDVSTKEGGPSKAQKIIAAELDRIDREWGLV